MITYQNNQGWHLIETSVYHVYQWITHNQQGKDWDLGPISRWRGKDNVVHVHDRV
jgi:hypothetical protein